MTETRVREVFPMSNGIMSVISTSGGYGFNADMDIRLLSVCGMRCITPIVEMLLDGSGTLSIDRLAALILSEYQDTWDKVKATLTLEYNPLSASQYNETETTETEGESTDNSTDVKQDDVSTSDAIPDSFISDGKSTTEQTGHGTNRNTQTRTLARTSNGTSYKPVDLLKSEIEMRIENKFASRVIDDVKNYIAMPIY